MASAGLLALIDDIATLLDDVALLSKVAARKTAGVLGDDLALNAQQVSGVKADRELPVVWAVAKGSAKNKLVIVPVALLLSAFFPWVIMPLLMLGGAFLCFEGFEKIAHKLLSKHESENMPISENFSDPQFDVLAYEQEKIKGAIRTDFILSAEIVVIALGTVQQVPLIQQILVVSFLAAAITVGVYGAVAGIVKLDDFGLYLMRNNTSSISKKAGRFILNACPYMMKGLSVLGTIAMFLVGGGILVHGFPFAHSILHELSLVFLLNWLPESVLSTFFNGVVGVVAGGGIVAVIEIIKRVFLVDQELSS